VVQKAVGDRMLRGDGSILDKIKLDGSRIIKPELRSVYAE
jgi:hypothetical protein